MLIKVKVHAGAKREEVRVIGENRFDVSVREKAKDNRANRRTIELLALHLKVPLKSLRIVRGHHMPSKIISVA